MAKVNIKYDSTRPAAPSSVEVVQFAQGSKVIVKFAATTESLGYRRFVKILWNAAQQTSDQVHQYTGTYSGDRTFTYSEVKGSQVALNFNMKNPKSDQIVVPWNTYGYFSVITYDQTFMEDYLTAEGKMVIERNPLNTSLAYPNANINYSADATYSSQFCSASEYVDMSNLNISYELDYVTSNKLKIYIAFKGYTGGANMTALKITCKQNVTNLYFNSAGTEAASESFTPPIGFDANPIIYTLPYENTKQTYSFSFQTMNAASTYFGDASYDTYNTRTIEEKIKAANWTTTPSEKLYEINGYRKRSSAYISNIDIKEESYVTKGEFVSKQYISQKALYALQLYSTEVFDFIDGLPTAPERYIRYYLQYVENGLWYRISPLHRRNETWIDINDQFDKNLLYVPKVHILDSNLSDDEQLKNTIDKNSSYISLSKQVYVFKFKIVLDVTSENTNFISPKIADYTIKTITRDILKSSILEEDIGNAG